MSSRVRWGVISFGALVLVAVGAVLLVSSGGSSRHKRSLAAGASELQQGKFNPDNGKEAQRTPSSPAAEQVANRAYPRNYVDDRRALASFRAFERIPSGHKAAVVGRGAVAGNGPVTGAWNELGPFTGNVAPSSSQFFDPKTFTGPTTQESGRVTALAIDPACAPGNCRMWVAAAGGGIWRTADALATHPTWTPPPNDLPTNAFGSLYYDAPRHVLYAGSGEPNGSSDSEAGLGLFKSTDFGASWSQVGGSVGISTNRSIGAIAVDPSDSSGNTIYIGTDVARHGSSSVNGGRRTPPGAPPIGVYKSTNGGASFSYEANLSAQTPPSPNTPDAGSDWFQGGINKLEFDPNNPNMLYASVFGYGLWRADQSKGNPSWEQVFHTMNQNDFSDPANPVGDTTGDRTEFDLVNVSGHTRAYVGDSSDDWSGSPSPTTPASMAWRVDNIDTAAAGDLVNSAGTTPETENPGWTELSSQVNGTNGFAAYNFCQTQCSYDEFVAHPPGASANTVWYGGSMNYDELPAYDVGGLGQAPRSNGRAVIRSTNAGAGTPGTASTTVSWQDMTAVLSNPNAAWGVANGQGIHPDLHAIAFAQNGNFAFIGSDGGVVRVDVHAPRDQSASCSHRTYQYPVSGNPGPAVPLQPADLADCRELLSGVPTQIAPLNSGLRTLQFQSVSYDPKYPKAVLLGGTQDNGTWSYNGSPAWLETIGGDGGQSGFNAAKPGIRFHHYYDATPEVNFHGDNPKTWLDIYDPLQITSESRSFYTPFVSDPKVGGRLFEGLQHVWRTDDNGGSEATLVHQGCYADNLTRTTPCGDWQPIGQDLTADNATFGSDRSGQYVVATERAPSDTGTLWAATRTGRVFISTNADSKNYASVVFHRLDSSTTPGRFVSGIAVDPANPDHAWISYSGYNAYTPDTPGHVFDVLYNRGSHTATFTDISHDLGDQPVTGLAVDHVSGSIFAATDFGVLQLAPGSNTWVQAGTAIPHVAVYGLRLADQGRVLYAATHGRGVWRLALPALPPRAPQGAIHGPTRIKLGQKVTYTATGSTPNAGAKLSFSWRLPGKPSKATGRRATFTATKPGSRTIVLTLRDSTGAHATVTLAVKVTGTVKPDVTVGPIAPVKLGHPSRIRGSATSVRGIRAARLLFGDGRSMTLHLHGGGTFTVNHRYRSAGNYTVTLRATDRSGRSASDRADAWVKR